MNPERGPDVWTVSGLFTLAISKCYGKVLALFSGRQLSRFTRFTHSFKSHSSRVRGLVVRCLLLRQRFHVRTRAYALIFLQAFRSRRFSLFSTPPFFRRCENFSLIFCNRTNVRKSQRVFSDFWAL